MEGNCSLLLTLFSILLQSTLLNSLCQCCNKRHFVYVILCGTECKPYMNWIHISLLLKEIDQQSDISINSGMNKNTLFSC